MQASSFKYGVIENPSEKVQLLNAIFRLRYQVYVEEWGFEEATDHPLGLETDIFDASAIHIYAYRDRKVNVVGTARIILDSKDGFPIEKHFEISKRPADISRNKIGEISRLSISKAYRRREIDKIIFGSGIADLHKLHAKKKAEQNLENERRKWEHELIRGIYLLIYQESRKLGLTHWYAVMARGLQIILSRWGIPFQQIGLEKEYHGLRAPYLLSIRSMEEHLLRKNPELLKLGIGNKDR